MGDAELKLVDKDRLRQRLLQELNLHRFLVGNAEVADLSGSFQDVESLRDLVRVRQRVRPVQKQHIQIIGLQTPEAPVDRFEDMLFGKIVKLIRSLPADAAFRLQNNFLADAVVHVNRIRKELLARPVVINIRMVEEIQALLHRGADQLFRAGLVEGPNPHTADCNHRHS